MSGSWSHRACGRSLTGALEAGIAPLGLEGGQLGVQGEGAGAEMARGCGEVTGPGVVRTRAGTAGAVTV